MTDWSRLYFQWLDLFSSKSRRSLQRRVQPRVDCGVQIVELLEPKATPSASPLAWNPGVSLPAPEANTAVVDRGYTIYLFGGGTTTVDTLTSGAAAWGTSTPLNTALISPGAGYDPYGILVYGGTGTGQRVLDSADQYTSSTDERPDTGTMTTPRTNFAYATDSSRNYAFGGKDDQGTILASAEMYDAGTGNWTLLAPMPQALYGASAVSDGGDHIIVFGGAKTNAVGSASNAAYEYTISTNQWTVLSSMPVAVSQSAAVLGTDGLMYVMGGIGTAGTTLGTVQVFDPAAQKWSTAVSLPNAVSNESAVMDSLGRIEVIGGLNSAHQAVASVYESQVLTQPYSAPVFQSTPIASGLTGSLYSYQPYASGNPTVKFSLVTAPTGMTMNNSTGLISWTPTKSQVGVFTVDVRATNLAGTVDQTYSITVRKSPPTTPTGLHVVSVTATSATLSWSPSTDINGPVTYTVYHFYVTGHSGRGGGNTYHYDPVGTNIIGTNFTVTGLTPGSQYMYVVKAFDATTSLSSTYSYTTTATTYTYAMFTGQPSGTTFQLTARHPFTMQLSATGNPTNFSYSIVNTPTGMTVNATTGVVSWSPPDSYANKTTSVTFRVSSGAGGGGTVTYNFTVAPNLPVMSYTSANFVNGTLYATPNQQLSVQLVDSSSNSTITWSLVTGPTGMTVNSATGVVTWTPAAASALGAQSATFRATNYAGTVTLTVPISVVFASAPPTLTATQLSSNGTSASATITWTAPTITSQPITQYEILVTQPGGPTGRFTTTYLVSGTARSYQLTGLDQSAYIDVQVIAMDATGHLGMPKLIEFVSPY